MWAPLGRQQFGHRVERARWRLDPLEHRHQSFELRALEAGAHFTAVLKPAGALGAEDQRSEMHACAARIGPAAHNELILLGELQLQPFGAAAPGPIWGP